MFYHADGVETMPSVLMCIRALATRKTLYSTILLSATLFLLDSARSKSSWLGVEHSWLLVPILLWWSLGAIAIVTLLLSTILDVLTLCALLIARMFRQRPME
jgi:hypothetical protein